MLEFNGAEKRFGPTIARCIDRFLDESHVTPVPHHERAPRQDPATGRTPGNVAG